MSSELIEDTATPASDAEGDAAAEELVVEELLVEEISIDGMCGVY
jgi:mycofactocin precursor